MGIVEECVGERCSAEEEEAVLGGNAAKFWRLATAEN
jgi:predicted TIM-barrel fold metal-dependent hydrolase